MPVSAALFSRPNSSTMADSGQCAFSPLGLGTIHRARARDLAIAAYRRAPTPQTTDTLGWALESVGEHRVP